MDRNLKRKLEGDEKFCRSVTKLVADYCKHGFDAVNYWTGEWDVAHDLLMAYAPLTKKDFEGLEKGHPRTFILPMTTTQITTAATFISQVLFGQDTPHKVEPRGPEDEVPAEHINSLLKWNAEQQPTFLLGYMWVQDTLTFNRGIFYNSWAPLLRPEPQVVEAIEVNTDGEAVLDEAGNPITYPTVRMVDSVIGGYCRMEIVSPYDWFCDPSIPLWRFQEGRYSGHRFKIPWTELERRSKLPIDDPAYVLPKAVAEIKAKKNSPSKSSISNTISSSGSMRSDAMISRSHHERMKANNPLSSEQVNKEDTGIVECVELWARLVPVDHGLHDGAAPVIFQFVVGNGDVILSVTESSYAHGMFPYSVAESRPSAHYQFAPGFALLLKGIQDHVDYLKNRHQEALQRTIGNVFIVDPTAVDTDDFMNPEKEGLLIPLRANAHGRKISEVIQQVAIKDLTERFPEEMQAFVTYSETVSGATAQMQGSPGDAGSATEFAGTQQMASGRLSNIARLVSVAGIVPQTRQFVSNFQQFLEEPQRVRYTPNVFDGPPELANEVFLTVSRDTIQGEFDFVAHDGTLPGTDARKVAAITRLLEGAALFPQIFSPAPGNLDPKKLIIAAAKASGLNPESFRYDAQGIGGAAVGAVSAQMGVVPQYGGPAAPEAPQAPPVGPGTPGPAPMVPSLPEMALNPLPSAAPPQIRPAAI